MRDIYINHPNDFDWLTAMMGAESDDEIDLKLRIKELYNKMKEILKGREKTILELRFGLGGTKPKTQHEIAEMLGISRSYVSRIETKAIGKLSEVIKE